MTLNRVWTLLDFKLFYYILFVDSDAAKKNLLPYSSLFCLAPAEAAPELHGRRARPRGARLVAAGRGAGRPPVGGAVPVHLVAHRPTAGRAAGTSPGSEHRSIFGKVLPSASRQKLEKLF